MSEANQQLQQQLRTLIPINELPANLQTCLFERAKILEVKKTSFIFKQGDKDNHSYYLLEGDIELHTNNQLNSIIQGNSERAKYALAQLQPRQFSAKAKTKLKILQIERTHMDQLLLLAQEQTANPMLKESTVAEVNEVDDGDWMTQMLQSKLFSHMPMANMHQLFALLEPVEKKAGEIVIQQGEIGEHYYIVSDGRCAVSRKPSPKSNDVKLAELKTGDSFGEEALISNLTRNATITMITDGSLMRLTKDAFIELIKEPTLQPLNFTDAEALIKEGAQWIDVRFPNEHQESSIKGSINIPLNSIRLQNDKLDDGKKYILYCDTGSRSSTGAFLLAERGFEVFFLEGGMVNKPEAASVNPAPPLPEEPKPATPKATSPKKETKADTDATREKESEESRKNLINKRKKLEAQKLAAEVEAKKKVKEEDLKLKKLKQDADKQMQQEKKQLEEIYSKNAKEMQRLKKAREQSEENMRAEREKLAQQAANAKKQLAETERINREIEAARKLLEEQSEKKRLEDEAYEKKLQAEAKAEIEEKRKKFAEHYVQNNKKFKNLQKEKEAAEVVLVTAKAEAEGMMREYTMSHGNAYAEEEAKLKAERLKLEKETRKIKEMMHEIKEAKLEAEKMKREALAEISALKEKQMDSTNSRIQREKLQAEIKVVEGKAIEAEKMKRIKEKAEIAKKKMASSNESLLADISKQLGEE